MTGRVWTRGVAAEGVAALWLMLKGYRILDRRRRAPTGSGAGEIDLVARRGRTLAFVEVKFRPDLDRAAFAIGAEQRRRIARAAEALVARHPRLGGLEIRFDAVLVAPWRWPRHLPGAWTPDPP